jgi:uncharacterized protein YukE
VGPTFDVRMEQWQAAMNPSGQHNGGHLPAGLQSQPDWKLYTQYTTKNWSSPDVAGKNLMVEPTELTTVAGHLKRMHDQLQSTLNTWTASAQAAAGAVAPPAGSGPAWPQAEQLKTAIAQTHSGIQQFVNNLSQAHDQIASKIGTSVANYNGAEDTNAKAARNALQAGAAAPTGTQVQAGGNDVTNDPTVNMPNLSPQARANISKLMAMDGNQPQWTNTLNITENAPYSGGATPKVTSQQLQTMLAGTNPDAVSRAATAYGPLVDKLTDMTGKLANYGQTLATNWGGTTAVTAVSQVQQLHQTATDLQANTFSAWQTLGWYGGVLSAFKNGSLPTPAPVNTAQVTASLPPGASNTPQVVQQAVNAQSAANQAAANQAAQQYLAALNSHIGTAYNNLPPVLNENLPPAPQKQSPTLAGGSGGGGGVGGVPPMGGGGGAGGSGPGGGVPPVPPISSVPPQGPGPGVPVSPGPLVPTQPGPTSPPPTLSQVPPGGPSPSPGSPTVPPIGQEPNPIGTPVPGGPGSPLPGVPFAPAPGNVSNSGSGADEVPRIGNLGTQSDIGDSGTGVAGNGEGVGADGAAGDGVGLAGEGTGLPGETPGSGFGFPGMGGFGGGGGAGGGQGRARQAWESEDQGLWDPQDEGALGELPMVSSDGMIGADAMPGDWAGAGAAGFGAGDGLGAGGGFGAGDGLGGSGGFGAGGGAGFSNGGGAGGAAAEDGAGFPMMGAGAGGRRDGSDRQRQAWMHEDPDIWGEEADRRVPPVIG